VELKLQNCARAGDRAGLFVARGIDRDSARGRQPAPREQHGSGTPITAVHCFRIEFSMTPSWTAPLEQCISAWSFSRGELLECVVDASGEGGVLKPPDDFRILALATTLRR
jgi:hypothetical protein